MLAILDEENNFKVPLEKLKIKSKKYNSTNKNWIPKSKLHEIVNKLGVFVEDEGIEKAAKELDYSS